MTLKLLDIADLSQVDPEPASELWRVVLVPLGTTPRSPRPVSEHASEDEAVDAVVKAAAELSGWSTDVLPPGRASGGPHRLPQRASR